VTTPVVVHGDDERGLIDRLTTLWAAIDEDYTPAHIGVEIPVTLTDTTQLQVQHETSPPDDYPARERAQTRITCWAPEDHRGQVKNLASRTLGLLTAMTPDAAGPVTTEVQRIGSVRVILGRSRVVQDPDTKNLAIWFLVRTSLRGTQLP
jgi:hypothetical protein